MFAPNDEILFLEIKPSTPEKRADFVVFRLLLSYRPSDAAIEHVQTLLERLKEEDLTAEEQRELDQYEQAELFMRLVKARVRARAS